MIYLFPKINQRNIKFYVFLLILIFLEVSSFFSFFFVFSILRYFSLHMISKFIIYLQIYNLLAKIYCSFVSTSLRFFCNFSMYWTQFCAVRKDKYSFGCYRRVLVSLVWRSMIKRVFATLKFNGQFNMRI